MKRRNNLRIISLVLIFFATIFMLIFSTTNVNADSHTNPEIARRNIAVRVSAQNLAKCWSNAKDEIPFKSTTDSYKLYSDTYWENKDMKVYFPKIMSYKTSSKDESSNCADLITGWKGNWFKSLFGGYSGDFIGVDQNIVVPSGNITDGASTMKKYLEGVGYRIQETKSNNSELNGYDCFYFNLSMPRSVFDNTSLYIPKSGVTNFVSVDTFCVALKGSAENNDEKKVDFLKELKHYGPEFDEQGNYFSKDVINKEMINLSNTVDLEFGLEKAGDRKNKKQFLKIKINSIHPSYTAIEAPGIERYFDIFAYGIDVIEQNNKKKDGAPSSDCYHWYLNKTYKCSLVEGDDENLTYGQLKARIVQYISGLKYKTIVGNEYEIFNTVESKDVGSLAIKYVKNIDSEGKTKTNEKMIKDFVTYFLDENGEKIINEGYALDEAEQYMFYYDHLKDYFSDGEIDSYLYDNVSSAGTGAIKVFWLTHENDLEFQTKYLNIPSSKSPTSKTACPLDNNNKWANCKTKKDWRYFATKLAKFDSESQLTDAFGGVTNLDQDMSDDYDNQQVDKDCKNSTSLGWLMCPLIEISASAVRSIYNDIETNYLVIRPDEIDKDDSLLENWRKFQNLSNIILIIIILFIVFSQFTGIGIDNYGIKKVIPKLIIAIILVNLSFYGCKLLIDVSNLTGSGIKQLFDNFAITAKISTEQPISLITNIATTGASAAGLVGAGAIAYFTWELWILPLALSLIVALVSVIVFYLIVALRKALVFILMIVSPVAIIMMILPNTQQVFKKWWKAFSGLLIAYPICGAVMGGSKYVSNLLIGAGGHKNFFYDLVTMLMSVVPFFFLPVVIKNSMKELGDLGAKISNKTKQTANSAKSGIQGTDGYNNKQKQLAAKNNTRKMGRIEGRLDKQVRKNGTYKDDNGNVVSTYSAMSSAEKARFAKENNDFTTQNRIAQMGAAAKKQEDYQNAVANGVYSTQDSVDANNNQAIDSAGVSYDKQSTWLDQYITSLVDESGEEYFGNDQNGYYSLNGNQMSEDDIASARKDGRVRSYISKKGTGDYETADGKYKLSNNEVNLANSRNGIDTKLDVIRKQNQITNESDRYGNAAYAISGMEDIEQQIRGATMKALVDANSQNNKNIGTDEGYRKVIEKEDVEIASLASSQDAKTIEAITAANSVQGENRATEAKLNSKEVGGHIEKLAKSKTHYRVNKQADIINVMDRNEEVRKRVSAYEDQTARQMEIEKLAQEKADLDENRKKKIREGTN